jgi:hypothetical protein
MAEVPCAFGRRAVPQLVEALASAQGAALAATLRTLAARVASQVRAAALSWHSETHRAWQSQPCSTLDACAPLRSRVPLAQDCAVVSKSRRRRARLCAWARPRSWSRT